MCQSHVPLKVLLAVESRSHAKLFMDVGTICDYLRYGSVERWKKASSVRRFAELRKNREGDVVLCATGRVKFYETCQAVGSKAISVPVGLLELKKGHSNLRPQVRVAGLRQLWCFRQALFVSLFVNFKNMSLPMIAVTLLRCKATVRLCGFSSPPAPFSSQVDGFSLHRLQLGRPCSLASIQLDTTKLPGSNVQRGPTRLQISEASLMDAPWFLTCARKREHVGNKFFHEGKVLHLTVVSGVFLQQDLISSGAIIWCSGYQLMLISRNFLINWSWSWSWSFFSSLELELPKWHPQKQRTRWLSGDFMACFVE